MKRVFRTWLASLVLLTASAVKAQEELKPVFLLTLPSYDEFMDDVDYVGKFSGQPQASEQLEQMLALFTQGQGLAGLDKTKPCGAVVFLDGGQPAGVFFVPVTNVKKLLEVLEPLVGLPEESQDHEGLLELSVNGQSMYIKQRNGWAWFSNSPDLLGKLPQDPQKWIGPLAKRYDFAVQLRVQNVPEIFRQMLLQMIREGAAAGMAQAQEENPKLRELQQKILRIQLKQLEDLFSSLDWLTFGCQVDRKARHLSLSIEFTLVPDSAYGRLMRGYSPMPSRLTGFSPQGAIFRFNAATRIGDPVREFYRREWTQAEKLLGNLQELLPEDDPQAQQVRKIFPFLQKYMQFLKEALKAEGCDVAFSVENRQGHLFLSGGLLMPGGPDLVGFVTQGLAKLADVAGEHLEIHRNVARQGDVRFHRITANLDDEDRAKVEKLFGQQTSVVLAVARDGIFAAYGSQSLELLRRRVAAARSQPPRKLKEFGYGEFALRPLLKLLEVQAPQQEAIPRMLEALPQGRDKVRLQSHLLPNGQRIDLVVEEGVLIALIKAFQYRQAEEEAPEF